MYLINDTTHIRMLSEDLFDEAFAKVLEGISESPYGGSDFDAEYLYEYLYGFIGNPQESVFLCLMIDNKVEGFIIGCKSTAALWHKGKVATELLWWVSPDHRKSGAGVHLVQLFLEWAKYAGCTQACVSSLNNEFMNSLDKVYTRLGFTLIEKAYVKDLV